MTITSSTLNAVLTSARGGATGVVEFWDPVDATDDWTNEMSHWDRMGLGGLPVPGVVEVRCTKARKLHKKDAPATNGAALTHLGYRPAEVTIKVTIWTPAHLAAWVALIKSIFPPTTTGGTGSAVEAVDVSHQALAIHGIKSLYIEEISPLQAGRVHGTMESTMRLTEYLEVQAAPAHTLKKSTGGITDVPKANSAATTALKPSSTDAAP